MDEDRLLSRKELAAALGVSTRTVDRWIHEQTGPPATLCRAAGAAGAGARWGAGGAGDGARVDARADRPARDPVPSGRRRWRWGDVEVWLRRARSPGPHWGYTPVRNGETAQDAARRSRHRSSDRFLLGAGRATVPYTSTTSRSRITQEV